MKCIITLALASILFPGIIRAQSGSFDNSTVRSFDLDRYLGTWYEIARFDHSFERGMQNVSAEYLLRDDGMVAVFNSGWKDGKYKVTEGKAKQPDPTGDPAHLRVSFFLFFSFSTVLLTSAARVGHNQRDLARTEKVKPLSSSQHTTHHESTRTSLACRSVSRPLSALPLPAPGKGQPSRVFPGHRLMACAQADWSSMFCLHVISINVNSAA